MKSTIYVGADHAGWKLGGIEPFAKRLFQADMGNEHLVNDDDYPISGMRWPKRGAPERTRHVLCGNAQGIRIVANKVRGVRAATDSTKRRRNQPCG